MRRIVLPLVVAICLSFLAGCGSTTNNASSSTSSPSRAGGGSHSTSGSSSSGSGVSATSARVTLYGYQYLVNTFGLTPETSITANDQTSDAPAGQEYLVATVNVSNPLSDRPEPIGPFDPNNGPQNGVLVLVANESSPWAKQLECPNQTQSNPDNLPAGTCSIPFETTVADSTQSFDASSGQIPANGSAQLQLAVGPWPTLRPLSDLSLYVAYDGTGSGDSTAAPTLVPVVREG